jgi:hypothetical protein
MRTVMIQVYERDYSPGYSRGRGDATHKHTEIVVLMHDTAYASLWHEVIQINGVIHTDVMGNTLEVETHLGDSARVIAALQGAVARAKANAPVVFDERSEVAPHQ